MCNQQVVTPLSPKVSVIVPIYNAQDTLEKCVESLRQQTLKEIEIILINDGSVDYSPKICDEYARQDDRIRVFHNTNNGPSRSRNIGIQYAIGEYIGFVDADDYVEAKMYEIMYEEADKRDVQILCCNYFQDRHPKGVYKEIHHEQLNDVVLGSEYIRDTIIPSLIMKTHFNPVGLSSLCNKIYSRKFLYESKVKLDIHRDHGEDWWFNIQLFKIATKIMFRKECLYHYVRYDSAKNLVSKYRPNFFELELKSRYEIRAHFSETYNLDTDVNNLEFIHKANNCIYRIFEREKQISKQKDLISIILRNEEYIKCYNKVSNLPLPLKLLRVNLYRNNYRICNILLRFYYIPLKLKAVVRRALSLYTSNSFSIRRLCQTKNVMG